MAKKVIKFCGKKSHKFGKMVSRGIVVKNKKTGRGVQRGYKRCTKKLCSKVVEFKRDVYVDKSGRVIGYGKWQEDKRYKPL